MTHILFIIRVSFIFISIVYCLQEFLASGDYDDVEDLEEKLGKFKGQSICVTCKNVCHLFLILNALY